MYARQRTEKLTLAVCITSRAQSHGGGVVTSAQLKRELEEFTLKRWNKEWKAYPEALQTKYWLPKVQYTNIYRTLSKDALSKTTGHGPVMYHLQKGEQDVDSTSRLCQQGEEQPKHLLYCSALQGEESYDVTQVTQSAVYDMSLVITSTMSFTQCDGLKEIWSTFVNEH